MANPIDKNMKTGTIGELLVQLRLLQYGVQAAPPIKDSGNDLVALKGRVVKLIQVKTTATEKFPKKPGKSKIYDYLAIVRLRGEDNELNLNDSIINLIPKKDVLGISASFNGLEKYEISRMVVEVAFKRESWPRRSAPPIRKQNT